LLRLIAVLTGRHCRRKCSAFPARAASDALFNQAAPRWFDQTVYRPSCPSIECDLRLPLRRVFAIRTADDGSSGPDDAPSM